MQTKPSFITLILCALAPGMQAEVKPNALFSYNAVLQQNAAVPVWGTASPGEEVTVAFGNQSKTVKADETGKWLVKLDPMPASAEPRDMTITGNLKSQISNLKCSSVLVGEVWVCSGQSNMAMGGKADPTATTTKVRMFTVDPKYSLKPQTELTGKWAECTGSVASAVGYFFGRDVAKATKVPVGMIRSSVGGTAAALWTSLAGLEKEPKFSVYAEPTREALANYDAAMAKYPQEVADYQVKLKEWETNGGKAYEDAKKALALENKKNKAEGKPMLPQPKPTTPKPIMPGSPDSGGFSGLYNGMIAPLMPYAIKGVVWYQGESNAGKAFEYRTLFPRMIADWREQWGQGAFPFFFVQIAPHNGQPPELREAQFLTSKNTPNTAMAVITDIGDAVNIHPPQKEPVGARLALAARALTYGEQIEYSGPEYDSFKVDKNKVVLSFKHVGGGLLAKDGPLKGFTIAGADKKFVEAKAEIVGNTVVVSSDQVAAPVAARFGWANVPDVNFWNKDGLPASPFRTDPEAIAAETPKGK